MTSRTIFIIGAFSPGSLGQSYRRAFESLGLATHFFEATNDGTHPMPWVIRNRITYRLTHDIGFVRSRSLKGWNDHLVESVLRSGADTVLSLTMQFLSPEAVSTLRRRQIRVIMFYPDNPFPPHWSSLPETLPTARQADLCLIWSKRLAIKLREVGVPRAAFLPFGWDPECFPPQEGKQSELWPGAIFLGSWDRQRANFLEELAGRIPLRIYGPDSWWKRTKSGSRVRQCWQGKDLRLADAAKAIRQSAICLNILRSQHVIDGHPDGVIMRNFEVPGARGFLLSTRDETAATLFPEGRTAEYYSSIDECVTKASWFIQNEAERETLIERAHSEVAAHHQYTNRAREILAMIES